MPPGGPGEGHGGLWGTFRGFPETPRFGPRYLKTHTFWQGPLRRRCAGWVDGHVDVEEVLASWGRCVVGMRPGLG